MNKVILIGRVGLDPELKESKTGNSYIKFTLATTEFGPKKEDGTRDKYPEWHALIAFGKTAGHISRFVVKGMQVAVTGRLQTSEYESEGTMRKSTSVVVENIEFLQSVSGGGKPETSQQKPLGEPGSDPDIPF